MLCNYLVSLALVHTGLSCSVYIQPGERLCLDNVEGYLGADCSGLVNILNVTQPCLGECPQEYPVLNGDGSCSECEGTVCPQCLQDQVWCGAESSCRAKSLPCGGQCSLHLYPLLGGDGQCVSCPRGETWCAGEARCVDKYTTPCDGMCEHGRLCNQTMSCIGWDSPCGSQCEYGEHCKVTDTCNSSFEPCGGECGPDRRLCDGYCITEEEPCGTTCSPHRQYCMQAASCLESNQTCPCPPYKWGCCLYRAADESLTTDYQEDQECEQQCDLADTDSSPRSHCRVEMSAATSWVREGYCHPSYTHTRQENSTKCVIKYVDL